MFNSLVHRAPEIGLHVNLGKCKRWSPTEPPASSLPYVPWSTGVKVLGVPIGSVPFAQAVYTRKLGKLQQGLLRLKLLGCSFSAFHILRSCLSACKVMFLLRTLPYDLAEALAEQAQTLLISSFNEVFDVNLQPTQWALARLPVRQGRLSILDPRDVAAPAHIASFLSSSAGAAAYGLPKCKIAGSFFRALMQLEASNPAHTKALRVLLREGQPIADDLAERELFETWCEQKQWTDAGHDYSAVLLAGVLPARSKKMRELSSAPHAGGCLLCPSARCPSPKWASTEWRVLVLWKLGCSLALPVLCVSCGTCQDPFGDHALSCTALGIYRRHNTVRDCIAAMAASFGLSCRTEVTLPGTDLVPADVFFPSFADEATAVDVSVVHPLHPSHCAHAAVIAGTAAEARSKEKVAVYGEKCSERSWVYWAVVAETTGAWSQAGQKFFGRLARTRALRTGESLSEASSSVWAAVTGALAKAVARQLVRAGQKPA